MAVLIVLLVIACVCDYSRSKIPNELLIWLLLAGGIGWGAEHGFLWMFAFPAACVPVMLLLYPFFKIGCIGAGDVKLLGICGAFLPFQKTFLFLLFSMLTAAVFSLIKIMKNRSARERFSYLCSYLAAVFLSGRWQLYFEDGRISEEVGVRLSGPALCSVLMYMGGVY